MHSNCISELTIYNSFKMKNGLLARLRSKMVHLFVLLYGNLLVLLIVWTIEEYCRIIVLDLLLSLLLYTTQEYCNLKIKSHISSLVWTIIFRINLHLEHSKSHNSEVFRNLKNMSNSRDVIYPVCLRDMNISLITSTSFKYTIRS